MRKLGVPKLCVAGQIRPIPMGLRTQCLSTRLAQDVIRSFLTFWDQAKV